MTEPKSITSTVDVSVDPDTAFRVFTEELNCWWLQGPINFFDSARAHEKRMEPGVGGRIVEVYEPNTGEGLELARITTWDPGARLGWSSSIDAIEIDVRFEAIESGTRVMLVATVAEDAGGSAWIRMTPVWFARWMTRREDEPHEPLRLSRLAVAIRYAKPVEAAVWLRDVFGLEPAGVIPDEERRDDHTWIEFHAGNASVIVLYGENGGDANGTHSPWVFVDDVDAHHVRVKAAGARILNDIWQHGARAYDVADLEGNHWTFAQASPRMRLG